MTKDELYRKYEEALAQIDDEAFKAREELRMVLRQQLANMREHHHTELKAIRKLEQKTRKNK